MAVENPIRDKVSEHVAANLKVAIVESHSMTAYEIVEACFDSIDQFRKRYKDWGVVAKQLMSSFESVTGQTISIAPSTLESYYYKVKAASGGKKKKKKSKSSSKAIPRAAKLLPMAEVAEVQVETVSDIPKDEVAQSAEVAEVQVEAVSDIPKDEVAQSAEVAEIQLDAVSDIPEDTVSPSVARKKKAASSEGGFQLPRRPGITPPVVL